MRRRQFIRLLGGAAAWPVAARAQQPAMPLIGFLNSQSYGTFMAPLRGFRAGLGQTGYSEGDNVAIEYRWAENQNERLPALTSELVGRRVAVIATFGTLATQTAKAATATIPIVFNIGDDPVKYGLVSSLARPGGNLTGVNFFAVELAAKHLELLRELVPNAARVAMLANPKDATITESAVRDVEAAARAVGLEVRVLRASTSSEIIAAFATLAAERFDGLFVGPGPFYTARRVQLTQLAARHAIPVVYPERQHAEVGGLVSYGASTTEAWRQVGLYVGRILKGAAPADLPVVQATKFELVVNVETARMLGLRLPLTLLARADEVIE